MNPSEDYPRMMFHRTLPWVIVQSREEEDALGSDWARTVWPAGEVPPAGPPREEPGESSEPLWPPEPAAEAFEPAPRKARRAVAKKR
jgi:hypothetical protein